MSPAYVSLSLSLGVDLSLSLGLGLNPTSVSVSVSVSASVSIPMSVSNTWGMLDAFFDSFGLSNGSASFAQAGQAVLQNSQISFLC